MYRGTLLPAVAANPGVVQAEAQGARDGDR